MFTIVDESGLPCGSCVDAEFCDLPGGHYVIDVEKPEGTNRWDGFEWISDEQVVLSDAKLVKRDEVLSSYDAAMKDLVTEYPVKERETWRKQEEEARVYMADNSVAVPALEALALASGRTVAELSAKIVMKADALSVASLSLTGKKQALLKTVDEALTVEAVNAVVWL